jgi:hypothetical protein
MASDVPPEDIRNVWQKQPSEGAEMLLEQVRKRLTKFEGEQRRIKIVGWITAVFMLPIFGFWLYVGNVVVDVGTALVAAGFLYGWWWVSRRRAEKNMPQDCGLKCSADFYRGELERERDVQRGIWRAYVATLPGMVIAIAGIQYGRTAHFAQEFFMTAGGVIAFSFLIWLLFNHQQEKVLRRRIDDLDAMVKGG